MSSKKFVALGLAGLLAMTACTDVNTVTSDPNQRQKEGAAVGAITGALIGLKTGKSKVARRNSAIVGGLVGGLAGSAVGRQLDAQAADLQANITNNNVQIINDGNQLTVRMPNDILFAFDSDVVGPTLRSDIGALAGNLQRYPNTTVQITGHTDDVGSRAYNRDLSLRRANAVAAILKANGVASWRIQTYGAGFDQPVASNATAAGRAQNRRVDIVIIPNG